MNNRRLMPLSLATIDTPPERTCSGLSAGLNSGSHFAN